MSLVRLRRNEVLALALSTLAAAALVSAVALPFANSESSQPSGRSEMNGSLVKSYESLQAVVADSELIVLGEVAATEQRPFGHFPFTLATIEVTKVLKGSAPIHLRVLQTGGTSIPQKDGSIAEGEARYQGVPVTRPGETYLFFLRPYEGPIAANAFVVLGEFQGKLKVGKDQRIQFTGRAESLTTPEFALPLWAHDRTRAEVVHLVGQYVDKDKKDDHQ